MNRFSVQEINLKRTISPESKKIWLQGDADHMAKKQKLCVYVRQSRGDSTIDQQTYDCINYIKQIFPKYISVLIFQDNGSAWKKDSQDKLLGIQKMFKAVQRWYFDKIIVYDVSRLSRNLEMGLQLRKGIKSYDLTVHSVMDKQIYTSDPISLDRFLEKILEAQRYSTNLSKRIRDNQRHRKEKGWKFGVAKYGMKSKIEKGIRTFVINPDEYKIIKIIKDRSNMSRQNNLKIAEFLNKKGHKKRGRLWSDSMVKTIVMKCFNMSDMKNSLSE
uniref:Resolvase/invertase-type recombinase catalytic domain-containing protein n=1 Tax=viral metagenome TaxID=1070528 RepID=A0A6C0LJ78_9ZZZZ